MTITNKHGLPQAMVDAVSVSEHNSEGRLSATTLMKSTREILLTKRHWSKLEDDVANRVWSIFGQAVHALLDKETATSFSEVDLGAKVLGKEVTGRLDCYNMQDKKISDYKTCSVWKIKFNDFSDWYRQGLIYAWLATKNGFEVTECEFIALIKDHTQTEASRNADYPQEPIFIYRFAVTPERLQEIETFIYAKVKEVERCEKLPDNELPLCTDEERWASPPKWAVMKEGRKTAIRLLDSESAAFNYINDNNLDRKHYVQERKGENRKCNGYCIACQYCDFGKSLKNENT